ncbi:MAG: ATP-binding protein [Myxococcales bacterium]|nr:PAS domain-containing protein [Myxococcales bacterium]
MPDLEEIRAALAQLPDPVSLLESLFARAPVALQIYDATGRSLLVNQAFLDLFGSQPPPEYNVLEDEIAAKNGVLALIQRAFGGETVTIPPVWYDPRELTQVRIEKGNRVAMSATFFPLFDRGGKVSHVAIVFKDLTAEMVQREEAEQERELLSAIVDQVSEGITMADEEGTLRIVNPAARELGARAGTPMAKWAETSQPGAPVREFPLAKALRGEMAQSIVNRRGPDGLVRSLNVVAVPLRRADGSLRGAVATFRDETERVRQEKETEQSAHFRERFIGILGHDLRTPLTAILASAKLVMRLRDLPDPALAAAARISSSAERMGRMIADLLDFTEARLGGGLTVKRKPGDLRDSVRACVDEVSAANPGRTIDVEVEGDTTGAFDSDRVAQLLSNLLTNAIAYGPPDEPVGVAARGLERTVEISVRNGGAAIPDAEREELFDPFRRGSKASGHARGLGLGLFIVQQIAQAHGGDVAVESAPGRTVFTAILQR